MSLNISINRRVKKVLFLIPKLKLKKNQNSILYQFTNAFEAIAVKIFQVRLL